ncbi:MAG TPA: hypothetical protein VGB53_16415, partial [Rubricoccaceae bacterium]
LDVGSVRLTERRFRTRPVDAASVEAARADVRAAVAGAPSVLGDAVAEALAQGAPVVATGSIARLLARLAGLDPDGGIPRVPLGVVAEWEGRLAALTPAETLTLDPARLAGREDVVAAAVLVLGTTLAALGAYAYVTARGGLRHGLALAAAEAP